MSTRRRLLIGALAVLAVAAVVAVVDRPAPATVAVPAGGSVPAALAGGADVVELGPGTHHGFEVTQRGVTVRGEPGSVVRGGVEVLADDVRLEAVTIEGGANGISVRDAVGVDLAGVSVSGSEVHGIEVVDGSATISDCAVSGITHEYGQAIEIRNANGNPRTVIDGCRVADSRDGIIAHVARLEIRNNDVTGTINKAISVTEMSEGIVEGNTVHHAVGVAISCGDYSRCEIRENRVHDMVPSPTGVRSLSGQAVVGWYHSTLRVHHNDFDVPAAVPVDVHTSSLLVEGDPLSYWPEGWRGALPGLTVTGWSLLATALTALALVPAFRWVRRRRPRLGREVPGAARLGWWALGTLLVVQGFHVFEHVVQVHQTFVALAEERAGLVGAAVDTEWLHLGFNAVVLMGIGVVIWLARHDLVRRHDSALLWLGAAGVAQIWHVAEHVTRVLQYLDTGISPAPGILGTRFGLVWFHFGINMTVIAGLLVAATLVARGLMRDRALREPASDLALLHLVGAGPR